MVRTTSRMGLGVFGLLASLGGPLAAQTLWLPASDPVGIARAGAGIAFGQSLEAASLNPALLVTLRNDVSAFVGMGMELQSSQTTLQSNSQVLFSADRNRALPSLGTAWKVRPDLFVGFKVDEPFMRHVEMPDQYSGRFEGQDLNLTTHRYEFQVGWAYNPQWSIGASLGATSINYSFQNAVRVPIPDNPALAMSATNPARGLLETGVAQSGTGAAFSATLGFRYAINPRWTVAGTWQHTMATTLALKARVVPSASEPVAISGFGPADPIAVQNGPALQSALTATPGYGRIELPGRYTLGVRNRVNQIFTWEADVRYVHGNHMFLPGDATLDGPSGPEAGTGLPGGNHAGFGISLMGEVAVTKTLMGRIGIMQDPGMKADPTVEPLLGGAKSSAFSAGVGYQIWGGELNVGWMTRLSQDRDVTNLDGTWSLNGPGTTGTATRVENMGHLWSIGFKKAF